MLCIVYRLGVISKNDEFQTIVFHSSSSLNQVTSSNNWYVSLWRGNQVCAEAKTNCICLLSPDLNTIEQLLDERPGSFGAISESSTASGYKLFVRPCYEAVNAAGEGHVWFWTNLTWVNLFRQERDLVKNLSFLKITPCLNTGE